MENDHKIMTRLQAIRERHKRLEDRIARESGRPLPDSLLLQRLKKLRLAAKEDRERAQANSNRTAQQSR